MPTQQFLEALRQHHTSSSDLILILAGLAVLTILLLLRNQRQKMSINRLKRRRIRSDFIEHCRDRGLTREEWVFLAEHGSFLGDGILSLFQSNASFDLLAKQLMNTATNSEVAFWNTRLSSIRCKLGYRPLSRGLALNSTRELAPGQTLYLVLPTDVFLEGVVSEVDETKLEVKLEAGTPPKAHLPTGMPVRIHFSRVSDARYSGTSYILDLLSLSAGMFIVLHHAEDLKRDQRRHDFRVDEDRNVSLWLIGPTEEFTEDFELIMAERTPERATLADLSGGGALLIFKRELPAHQRLYLNLDVTKAYNLPLIRATVVRASRRRSLSCWAVSVRLEDLRPSERQKLIRYVFLQERESHRPEGMTLSSASEETLKI